MGPTREQGLSGLVVPLRATFRHEWTSYLTIVLLLGLVGGLAMGSLAAARRTQFSYSALLESTNPSQIVVATAIASPTIGNGQGYNPAIVREIAQAPHIAAVASATGINAEPLSSAGAPIGKGPYTVQAGTGQGSVGGEYFRIDRLAISAGRAADPARVDEFVISPTAAAAFGFHVGEIVPMGFYTNSQTDLPGFGTATVKPYRRIDMRVTGIGLPVTEIVTDDVDAGGALGYFTPALTQELLRCCVNYTETAIKVANPDQVAGLEDAITRSAPGAGSAQNPWLHQLPAKGRRCLAVERGRGYRGGRGYPSWHYHRSNALGPLCPGDRCSAFPRYPRCPHNPDRTRCSGARQCRGRHPGTYCCPNSSGAGIANRMTAFVSN